MIARWNPRDDQRWTPSFQSLSAVTFSALQLLRTEKYSAVSKKYALILLVLEYLVFTQYYWFSEDFIWIVSKRVDDKIERWLPSQKRKKWSLKWHSRCLNNVVFPNCLQKDSKNSFFDTFFKICFPHKWAV